MNTTFVMRSVTGQNSQLQLGVTGGGGASTDATQVTLMEEAGTSGNAVMNRA